MVEVPSKHATPSKSQVEVSRDFSQILFMLNGIGG